MINLVSLFVQAAVVNLFVRRARYLLTAGSAGSAFAVRRAVARRLHDTHRSLGFVRLSRLVPARCTLDASPSVDLVPSRTTRSLHSVTKQTVSLVHADSPTPSSEFPRLVKRSSRDGSRESGRVARLCCGVRSVTPGRRGASRAG